MSFDPARDEDAYKLEAWAFNVMLECSGLADEQPSEVAIGGAILDFRDLDLILNWAREQALAIEAATAGETTKIGSTQGESAGPKDNAQKGSDNGR